jgi:hypothetical protein
MGHTSKLKSALGRYQWLKTVILYTTDKNNCKVEFPQEAEAQNQPPRLETRPEDP